MTGIRVETFFANYPERVYSKGDLLIMPNKQLNTVFYIVSGSVVEYDISHSGSKVILNTFKQGAFFPMSNAINAVDTPYFFEADEAVRVRVAPAKEVVAFVKQEPEILYDLLSRTYKGVDGVLSRLANLMHSDATSRVLNELAIYGKRFGIQVSDGSVHVTRRMTETELAERVGASRETVSRIMSKLKTKGIVEITTEGTLILRLRGTQT